MGENVKITKWGVTVLVSLFGLIVAIFVQTALAFRWAGDVSARLDAVNTSVKETKSDLTRRIERLEDGKNHNP